MTSYTRGKNPHGIYIYIHLYIYICIYILGQAQAMVSAPDLESSPLLIGVYIDYLYISVYMQPLYNIILYALTN